MSVLTNSKTANIFDPIEHSLDQRIFDGIEPRTSVVKFIQRVYYHALDRKLGVTGTEWADLYFTGSLTTYQYSQTSDADISVFPDYDRIYKHLGIDPMSARRMLIEMSIHYLDGTFLPGTQHPLQFFVVPYGTLPQDLYQPGLRSAYNLLDRHWLVPPERERSHNVMEEMPQAYERAEEIADKLKTMLDNGSYDEARELWHNVHAKRQLDQRAGLGDYCEGNIVYKWLLHEGLFDRIRNELHEFVASVKEAMPPANQAPEFRQMYQQTPDHPFGDQNPNGVQGYDWKVNPQAINKLHHMEQWRLPPINVKIMQPPSGWGHDTGEQWTRLLGFATANSVSLHPFQTAQQANETLWHEIQHVYQIAERRWHNENYNWTNPSNPSQYDEHPMELDANGFAQVMSDVPLIIPTAPYDNPSWVPHELHLDRGDWDEQREEYRLSEQDLASELAAQVKMFRQNRDLWMSTWMSPEEYDNYIYGAVDYNDGMGINGPSISDYQFRMPPEIENRYIEAMECPSCGGHLRREETGKIYCEQCGWRPHQSATDHLWDERVTTKVIYDFAADRIILGTQADLPRLEGDNKIVGEYKDGKVTLFEADKQWINPTYFRRLWHVSYPERELKDVYFRRESGDEYKLRSLPRTRKKKAATGIEGLDALITEFRNVQVEDLKGQIGIEDLKDPKIAEGLCHTFSLKFADFVHKHGYEAWIPKYGTGTPEVVGYGDRTIKGRTGHYWTYVKADGKTFSVDWTAAQFGYEDLPLVQELTESGWVRDY